LAWLFPRDNDDIVHYASRRPLAGTARNIESRICIGVGGAAFIGCMAGGLSVHDDGWIDEYPVEEGVGVGRGGDTG